MQKRLKGRHRRRLARCKVFHEHPQAIAKGSVLGKINLHYLITKNVIVPSGSCVRTRRSQAALMAKFAKFRRFRRLNFVIFAMRAAWLRAISHTTPARHYSL